MNIAAIKKRCIEYGACIIITNGSEQWIGTGREFYPVQGVRLTAESIPGLFGLTRKEQDELEIRAEENALQELLTGCITNEDEPCAEKLIEVNFGTGALHQVIGKESGARRWYFVNGEVPAKRKDTRLELFMRGNCLVLAHGMIVEAVIGMLGKADQEQLETELKILAGGDMEDESEIDQEHG